MHVVHRFESLLRMWDGAKVYRFHPASNGAVRQFNGELFPHRRRAAIAQTGIAINFARAKFDDQLVSHRPPILHTSFHSFSVTGWTERRKEVTKLMSFNFGLAFTAARVTGLGMSFTAFTTTRPNLPVSSVGSGWYSWVTSTIPTICFSSPV